MSKSIVWTTGYPGCGKTTVGDYLEIYYGYKHIDVDNDFMLPRFKDGKPNADDPLLAGYMRSWKAFFGGDAPLEEDFGPFLDQLIVKINALKDANADAKIVITQGMHREGRDYFARKLKTELGLPIFFVGLASSIEKKMKRWKIKMDAFIPASQNGKSHEEAFKERTGTEFTDENFEKDWRAANVSRIPLMDKFDVDPDEIREGCGANVLLDEGDDKVFPSVKEILGCGDPSKDENLQDLLAESAKRLEIFSIVKKDEVKD